MIADIPPPSILIYLLLHTRVVTLDCHILEISLKASGPNSALTMKSIELLWNGFTLL